MREKGQTEVAKTLGTPVFSRGIEILTEKIKLYEFENAHKDDPNYEGERIIAKKYRELEEYFKDYL